MRRESRRRPSSGGRARLLAAAGRADVEEGLQRGRPQPRRHKEGRERWNGERHNVKRLEDGRDEQGEDRERRDALRRRRLEERLAERRGGDALDDRRGQRRKDA